MPRGRRIKNPLREGLPSKVYLAAYPGEKTVGDLAVEIYGEAKKSNRTRISDTIHKEGWSHLFRTRSIQPDFRKTRVLSRVDPFLSEIESSLKSQGKKLSKGERKRLRNYLDTGFRRATKYLHIDYKQRGSVDAYVVLLDRLLWFLSFELAYEKMRKILVRRGIDADWEDVWEAFYRACREEGRSPVWKDEEVFRPLRHLNRRLMLKIALKVRVDGMLPLSGIMIGVGERLVEKMSKGRA